MITPQHHIVVAPRATWWRFGILRMPRMPRMVLAGAMLAWLSGCTTLIIPPMAPTDPVSVFVLDHGRHSSLVLPDEGGTAVRYSYGDWDYYVLEHTSLRHGLRALLGPTPAALGQQRLAGPAQAHAIRHQLRVEVLTFHEIRVDASAAQRLREQLGALFESAVHTRHYQDTYDVHFVRHPEPYTLINNSNHMVKRWLEQLGCEVPGTRPLLSNWRVRPPRNDGAAHPL